MAVASVQYRTAWTLTIRSSHKVTQHRACGVTADATLGSARISRIALEWQLPQPDPYAGIRAGVSRRSTGHLGTCRRSRSTPTLYQQVCIQDNRESTTAFSVHVPRVGIVI